MASPKIVLATIGSLGDLHPFLAIGQALRDRGASPVLAVPVDHLEKCREAGLEAEAILPSFADIMAALGLDETAFLQSIIGERDFLIDKILMPPLRDCTDRLITLAKNADLIVSTPAVLAAPIAAEVVSRPFVPAILQPMCWFSSAAPPVPQGFNPFVMMPSSRLGHGWNRIIYRTSGALLRLRYGKRINAVRQAHGLPPSATVPMLETGVKPALSLGLYSAALAPLPSDATSPALLTGFPWFDSADGRNSILDARLAAFLADGDPPLVISLGSFVPHAAQDLYRRAAEFAASLGMRALLLTTVDMPIDDPCIMIAPYAPHSLVFPHAAAIIHHGGIGTTGQALRAGKPQLVIPFLGDQFDQAYRITALGVGTSATERQFAKYGLAILRDLLGNAQYRAKATEIQQELRHDDGAAVAAEALLRLVAQ